VADEGGQVAGELAEASTVCRREVGLAAEGPNLAFEFGSGFTGHFN
jgi:hypothetical protein